jgi:O-antigen/teichoic acid export membrane protein
MYVLRAVLAIALGAVAGTLWGYRGVIGAELVALLAVLITARSVWLPHIGVARPDPLVFKRLLRAGWPLMLSNVVVALSVTTDRIFVASALPQEFGQYAFASLVVVGWIAINGMLEQAVAPRLLTDYGAGTRLPDIRRQAVRIAGALAAAGLAGLALLLLVKGPLTRGFLSEYEVGLDAMPVLWLGGVLMLLSFPGFILHAIRPSYSLIAAGLAACVAVGGGIALTLGDPSVQDFAWLFVASQATSLLTITTAVGIEARRDRVSPDLFRTETSSEG